MSINYKQLSQFDKKHRKEVKGKRHFTILQIEMATDMKETLQFTSCQGVKINVILRCHFTPSRDKN